MTSRSNEEWRVALRSQGAEQAAALADLRALLLRGALYSFRRSHYDLAGLHESEVRQLAEDCAQEALLSVLKHLDEFRGESRFTTWAYKFAINLALSSARRVSWKQVSLDDLVDGRNLAVLQVTEDRDGADPDRAAWRAEVWETVRDVIEQELSERQRQVLVAVAFEDVPMDEVARQLHTNRNAVYKLLHDARRKLKSRLQARGLAVGEVMDLFGRA